MATLSHIVRQINPIFYLRQKKHICRMRAGVNWTKQIVSDALRCRCYHTYNTNITRAKNRQQQSSHRTYWLVRHIHSNPVCYWNSDGIPFVAASSTIDIANAQHVSLRGAPLVLSHLPGAYLCVNTSHCLHKHTYGGLLRSNTPLLDLTVTPTRWSIHRYIHITTSYIIHGLICCYHH